MAKLSKWLTRSAERQVISDRCEICLTGSGGQGIVLAGVVLAKAASIFEGRNATQTQSYGPESRGGASRCELVISDNEIDYPKTMKLDLLLAFTQEGLLKQVENLREDALVVVDSVYVKGTEKPLPNCFSAPFTKIAITEFGGALSANMIALGAFVGLSGVVGREALKQALASHVREKFRGSNLKALDRGFQQADSWLAELKQDS